MTPALERRYRRLLACYPAAHRAEYADEMIGVLMSTATPGQRHPNLGEAVDLVASGLRARLGTPLRAARTPVWREAAGVFAFFAAVATAVPSAYAAVAALAWRHVGFGGSLPRATMALAMGWTVVAVVTGLGWWRIAAATATLGAAGQAVAMAWTYTDDPGALVTSWWSLVLATTAAAALLSLVRAPVPAPQPGQWRRPFGVRAIGAVTVAAILVLLAPIVEVALTTVTPVGPGVWTMSDPFPTPLLNGRHLATFVLLATLAVVVFRLRPTVRRRVLLLAAPTGATALLVWQTFGGFLVSSPRFWPPVVLIAPQWVALVATPVLTFALGAWLLARYEHKLASGALVA